MPALTETGVFYKNHNNKNVTNLKLLIKTLQSICGERINILDCNVEVIGPKSLKFDQFENNTSILQLTHLDSWNCPPCRLFSS